ncbi:hypothetical protein H2198_005987 [Neophaeococcomyces mojaviensis]|uniref:Uncharacterized protein n=1 Tax=Neophaeococcomyces mojaviensis TaxID=3383035 RepID=A0ACC3A402_9EURO|nr:hypothetical protein H2198_005987 [Knufia sp. JES_112]
MLTEGIVVESPGAPFKYQTLELDEHMREDEVHVKIKATGICHTDVIFSQEKTMPDMFPGVMGHEGAGVVESVGPKVTRIQPGDHVIVAFSCCGECSYCEKKQTGYCDVWFQYNFGIGRLDGSKAFTYPNGGRRVCSHFFGQSSFARDIYVKETGLVKVDKSIPFSKLAPLACGLMTGAGGMLNVINPTPDMTVAVVGTGSVGLSAIMALKLLDKPPRRIIAVDVVPSRLELARSFGATHGVNSKLRPDLMSVMMNITDGKGIDGSIDTTGRPDVIQNLIHSCARKGKVVTIGTGGVSANVEINLFEIVQAGCSYIGCQQGDCYPQEFLPRLLAASQEGKFPYEKLLKTYPAKDVAKAIRDMEKGETIKPVLLWD